MKLFKALYRLLIHPRQFYRESVLSRLLGGMQPYIENLSRTEKKFVRILSRYRVHNNAKIKDVVLMQMVEDPAFSLKMAATTNYLAKKHSANVALYSVEGGIGRVNSEKTIPKFIYKYFFTEKIDKIHSCISSKILYRNSDLFTDNRFVLDTFKKLKLQIQSKEDVVALSLDGVQIGDLVYDTYLRFAHKSTVDITDPFLDKILLQAINIYYVSNQKLKEYNVIALVNSYTTYTKHGIVVRLCIQKNIPVYIQFCGYSFLIHKISSDNYGHVNNHFRYPKLFDKIKDKESILIKYKEDFEKRFEGKIDGATSYMKKSAFSTDVDLRLEKLNWSKTVVVFAHCFFDSPHAYRKFIFPDFIEWINFTLDELVKHSDIQIIVKEHPNGLKGNKEILSKIKLKYQKNNVLFIDKSTSQLQLINLRPMAVITAYGTVASEFSYHNVPVLTVYDNPFAAYDFVNLANSIDEYKDYLVNIVNLKSKQNKADIIEFYYMNNVFFLGGYESDYLKISHYRALTTTEDEFLRSYLVEMTESYFQILDKSIKDGFNIVEWEDNYK